MTETAVLPLRIGPRQTFWAIVSRAYWRSPLNRLMSFWIFLIALLTVLVPFIANGAPYTAMINGHREFPLFRDLTSIDWIWLVWGLAATVYSAVHWRTGRRIAEVEPLRAARFKWLAGLILLSLTASGSILALHTDYLDGRNYHSMSATGELPDAVFPPLRWGFQEQESLSADRLNKPPTWLDSPRTYDHLLGTDSVGRDVLSRLLWGGRLVFEIGLVSEVISLIIGVIYGAFMGYFVGAVDILGMRFVEIVEAIPLLFLLITVVALFGRQLFVIMLILGLTGWTGIARFVRAEFLRIREMDYVTAARSLGLPLPNILFKHMLPNGLTPVIVSFTFGVAGNIVSESILSFLGIGVEPPTASWGSMLANAVDPGEAFRWWLALAPGIMIFITVFAYNVIGEGLRDAIDPRTNKVQ